MTTENQQYVNSFRNRSMMIDYCQRMIKMLRIMHPEMSESRIKETVISTVKKRMSDPSNIEHIQIDGQDIPVNDFDNIFINIQPIMSGSGTMYYRHEQVENERIKMINTFTTNRKIAKKKMFEHINDEDQTLHDSYEMEQKTWKIMNNSFYGVLIQRQSQFHDNHSGKSVTASGVDIISTSINLYEKLLGNNIYFESVDEIFNYITRIVSENYDVNDSSLTFNEDRFKQIIDPGYLTEYLAGFLVYKPKCEELNLVTQYLEKIPAKYRLRIYYKNNMIKFFEDTNIVDLYVDKCLSGSKFYDPNEPPEDLVENLTKIWNLFRNYLLYNYQDFHRFKNVKERKRRSVLLVDTDSSFVYLDPILTTIREKSSIGFNEDDVDSLVSAVNIIMYEIMKCTDEAIYKFQRETGVPESHAHVVGLKNEFLLKKIMLTKNKKSYAQIILLQEGNLLDKPDFDIKGLAIRKVSTNAVVRKDISNLLKEEILIPTEVEYSNIIRRYKELEEKIVKSLQQGELDFTIPSKVNVLESYKNPFTIQAFNATYVWNMLYPQSPIVPPAKIRTIKTNIDSWDDIESNIDQSSELYANFKKLWNDPNTEFDKKGIKAIAIGEETKSIPEELRPFVNINEMLNNHIAAGIPIIESVGLKTLALTNGKYIPSNIVNI